MQNDDRRVLILSHNALSDTQNNGKTLTSFFEGWSREKLAQLYLSIDRPSFTICDRFFQCTDMGMLRALFSGAQAGAIVERQERDQGKATEKGGRLTQRIWPALQWALGRHYPLPEYMRDLLWRGGRWRSTALCEWLDAFAPEAVFFQGSNYPFAYDIALWICARYGIKLLIQLTDDYTYVPHPLLPMAWVFHFRYLKRFKEGLARAQAVYAISPAMREEYARRFGYGRFEVAANCVALSPVTPEPSEQTVLRLLYAGSTHTGRWRVLREIGRALSALRGEGLHAVLEIYTPRPLPERLRHKLTIDPVLAVRGSLTPGQLAEAMGEANVLVMVESFARSARKVTRLSLSTKIPEYMAAGRCILAVGPGDVSSMAYLQTHGAAIVADQPGHDALVDTLRGLFDPDRRAVCAQNGLRLAQAAHQKSALQAMIRQEISQEIRDEERVVNSRWR